MTEGDGVESMTWMTVNSGGAMMIVVEDLEARLCDGAGSKVAETYRQIE